jgi:hypothetical protein
MTAALAGAVLGVWLMAAPAVLGYGGASADNHRIVGPLAAAVGIVAASGSLRSLRWVNLPLGLWLLASPALLASPSAAAVQSLLCGGLLAFLSTVGGRRPRRLGGGWASLFRDSASR